jgi:hypothetical protein
VQEWVTACGVVKRLKRKGEKKEQERRGGYYGNGNGERGEVVRDGRGKSRRITVSDTFKG